MSLEGFPGYTTFASCSTSASTLKCIPWDTVPTFKIALPQQNDSYEAQFVKNISQSSVFSRIKYLAVSTMCFIDPAFTFFKSLEGLAMIAVINHPFTPFAHSRADFEMVLNNLDTTGNGKCLKTFRIMVEDGLDPTHFE
ncbi:LOW QUALITY PROTEIN: hypothetical protein CVT25_000377 [Psilocybe cyanescens]|uniref:Uncharacterized protein n=1 Tax=Psilocybe cyanescens TaxID=93625 RepID=A0A409XEW9_PSICY|nr:LOW QUALITY PROTEIN: hypothetical protein CVT25_000377 [Psilocybe cyanescens]